MKCKIWNQKTYQQFIDYLFTYQDIKYQEFNRKLISTKSKIIGVKMPILRRIAKQISKNNPKDFLNLNDNKYYETRSFPQRTIEKNKCLSKLYCKLYRMKKNTIKMNLISIFLIIFFFLFSCIILNNFLNYKAIYYDFIFSNLLFDKLFII